jgi:hypothetical protein
VTVPTDSAGVTSSVAGNPISVSGARTRVKYNLAAGKYWTSHEAKIGDFLTYLSVNGYATVDDRGPRRRGNVDVQQSADSTASGEVWV